ncbi:MAG: protein kinase [Anaerolineae bacterium]|nr:protein kinase [Anaerolineae bacterium]
MMIDWRGKQIGKYEVKDLLGQGGMGQVYQAYHPALERDVAIKTIYPHLARDPDFVTRFQREAKLVAALRHPGIVQVHDFDVADSTFYMVMEFVQGETLEKRLATCQAQGEQIPLPEALRLFQLITQAVAHAHSQKILHRDLKPANVLLTPQGQPILADFGLSKIIGAERLADTGSVLGTPAYMSPEQCASEPGDERSDIYALGIMLYELTTGSLPFSSKTPVGIILKHISEPPAPPRTLNPHLPAGVEAIIQKALEKKPAHRFQSVQEMLEALEETVALPLAGLPPLPAEAEADRRCPYRGLQAFEEEHAEFFFGREVLVDQLVDTLNTLLSDQDTRQEGTTRFLAVLGASGSGKSSLVRAGLIPTLRAGVISGSNMWAIHILKPDERPLEALAAGLAPVLASQENHLKETRRLLDNLATDSRALHLAVRLAWQNKSPEQRLLLIVDQFEEVFTLCQNEDERRRFIENLLYAAAVGKGRVFVSLTMRADFYHRCAAYRDLAARISTQQVLVGPMSEAELRRAIERPAQVAGLRFEPGLVDTILADVAQQPGALPLLQHALLELWEWRHGQLLTLRAYQTSGGVPGAIAQRAETLYATFRPQEQIIVRRVMLRLTQPGEGTEDTRRRVHKSELLPDPKDPKFAGQVKAIESVIHQLADARLVTTGRDIVTGEEQIDVAHEALIRGWARLRGWLDENRTALRTHRRLTEAANEWERQRREKSYLYRGGRLTEAEEFATAYAADMNPVEREFLQASIDLRTREAQEAEQRRQQELIQAQRLAEEQRLRAEEQTQAATQLRRRALWLSSALLMLGVVLLVALMAFIAAIVFGRQASNNAELAQAEANHAIAAEGTAQAEATRAIAAESTAVAEADRALAAEKTAQAEADRALKAEGTAVAQRLETEHQREIALARQLAAQALTYMDDRLDLALLLSLEANRFTNTVEVKSSLLTGLESAGPHLTALLRGHTDDVTGIAFSPDGQTLASSSFDRSIILWDMNTRQALGEPIALPWSPVSNVAFSPDGQTLASVDITGAIILWDAETREQLGQLSVNLPPTGVNMAVQTMAFSPDGQTLAVGKCKEVSADIACQKGEILLWDVESRQLRGESLTGHTNDISSVAFSPDGQILASGSWDNTIILWDVATGQPVGDPLTGHTNSVNSVAFSPDRRILASGSADDTIILWDMETRQPIGEPLTGHEDGVLNVAFSPDSKMLASGSSDKTIILWDVKKGQPIGQPLTGHTTDVESVSFSPTENLLASSELNKTILLWDVSAHESLGRPFTDPKSYLRAIAMSPDGQTLASVGFNNEIVLWDAISGQPIGEPLTGHTDSVWGMTFSPDGKMLVSGSWDDTIILWDVETGQPSGEPLTGHTTDVRCVAFSPDGAMLASGDSDSNIILWDVATGQPIGEPLTDHHSSVGSIVFSPDGKILASAGGNLILWDVATQQPLDVPLVGHTNYVGNVVFSPDGQMLASGGYDQTIILWNVATGQPLGQPLVSHTRNILDMAFSPDGQMLASADPEAIILWDVASGQPIGQPLDGSAFDILFSPDGKTLISADNGITLWDVDFVSWQARACRMANRNLTQAEWEQFIGADTPYQRTCPDLPSGEAAQSAP